MKRKLFWIVLVLTLALITLPVYAGGWSVLTMDALPGDIRAGEEVTMGFTVRGHGHTPANNLTPMLEASNPQTGERLEAQAQPGAGEGHYTVSVTFPSEGQWQWQITPYPYPQVAHMAPLTVLPAAAPAAESTTMTTVAATLPQILRTVALLLLVAAGILFLLDRRQSASTPAISPSGD